MINQAGRNFSSQYKMPHDIEHKSTNIVNDKTVDLWLVRHTSCPHKSWACFQQQGTSGLTCRQSLLCRCYTTERKNTLLNVLWAQYSDPSRDTSALLGKENLQHSLLTVQAPSTQHTGIKSEGSRKDAAGGRLWPFFLTPQLGGWGKKTINSRPA